MTHHEAVSATSEIFAIGVTELLRMVDVLASFMSDLYDDCPNCDIRINGVYRNNDVDGLVLYEGCDSCKPIRAIFRFMRDIPRSTQTLLQLRDAERRFCELEANRRVAIGPKQPHELSPAAARGYMQITEEWEETWHEVVRLRESAESQQLL